MFDRDAVFNACRKHDFHSEFESRWSEVTSATARA
jgi:hypothetical protein